jgi:hypothetical protein
MCVFLSAVYWIFAATVSLFYGIHAVTIHLRAPEGPSYGVPQDCKPWRNYREVRSHPWFLHQAWFNFAGSLMGWAAGYYAYWRLDRGNAGAFEAGLLLAAALGMTGYLPRTLNGIAGSFGVFADKLRELISRGA